MAFSSALHTRGANSYKPRLIGVSLMCRAEESVYGGRPVGELLVREERERGNQDAVHHQRTCHHCSSRRDKDSLKEFPDQGSGEIWVEEGNVVSSILGLRVLSSEEPSSTLHCGPADSFGGACSVMAEISQLLLPVLPHTPARAMQPSTLHPAMATSVIDHHHLGLTLQSTSGVAPHNSFHPTLHVRRVMSGGGPVKTTREEQTR